ncbi:hypothetical protein [Motiliproteus coralliicola]|uniref:hypothetical protein n=1 Tax=Motiliproteus coralliicola TaxID=2283196 RepID=UPI0014037438|nr:hypothetical protein [Motiliproteus coralliicola]
MLSFEPFQFSTSISQARPQSQLSEKPRPVASTHKLVSKPRATPVAIDKVAILSNN